MKNFILLFLAIVYLTFSSGLTYGQSQSFTYKTKGKKLLKINATLCDKNGNTSFNTEEFIQSPDIYFLLSTNPEEKKNILRISDIDRYIKPIRLKQNNKFFNQNIDPIKKMANAKELSSVIIGFSKKDFVYYKDFFLVTTYGESKEMKLPEVYWPVYKKYSSIYNSGKKQYDEKQYLKAFKSFYSIWEGAQSEKTITYLSFYKNSLELTKKSIQAKGEYLDNLYRELKKSSENKITKKWFAKCDSVKQIINFILPNYNNIFKSDFPGIKGLKTYISNVQQEVNKLCSEKKKEYNKQIMSFLETGNLSDYKYSLYIDLLSRILSYTDSLVNINKTPLYRVSNLKYFPKKEQELKSTGWFNNFNEVVQVLNATITEDHIIIPDEVMANLNRQDSLQHQPYYKIFKAFSYLPDNLEEFINMLNDASISLTDIKWLNKLELWNFSAQFKNLNVDSRYYHEINNGLQQIKLHEWGKATQTFNVIKRQANQLAIPWFYSGLILYNKHQVFSAEAQFQRALNLYPKYISPREFIFKVLENQKQYTDLLNKANKAIKDFNIWYFHFVKAKAFFAQKKYDETIKEIKSQCIKINPWAVNEYYLLGDVYLAQRKYNKAKAAYETTQKIAPFSDSKVFEQKMKLLIFEKNKPKPIETQNKSLEKVVVTDSIQK